MGKLLRPRDILLLGLAGALDVFEETRDPLHLLSQGYKSMYGWVPRRFKRNNFSHLVWRSIKTGYIEKVEKDQELYLRLTAQGNEKITRDFPLLGFQKKSWDRKWRVVIFDIEEANRRARDRLRYKLKELGFGMLQESVFITPHDIAQDMTEFIESIGLSQATYLFEMTNISVGDKKELARRVWKLDEINDRYGEIVEKIESEYLNLQRGRGNRLKDKWREFIERTRKEYLDVMLSDPFLPKELLPSDWQGNAARKRLEELGR